MTTWTRCRQRVHLIQHAFVHGRRLGVIPSERAFPEWIKFGSRRSRHVRKGSSCTHDVVEVVVQESKRKWSFMSVDVRGHDTGLDVHGVFSNGRGTCFEGEVKVPAISAMVVKLDAPKGYLADNGRRVT